MGPCSVSARPWLWAPMCPASPGGRQDRRLQDLAGRVVAAQSPLRQEDRQPRFPQDRPRGLRNRGGRVREPVFQGQGPRFDLPEGSEEARQRRGRDLRSDHDRRRGRHERSRSRTTRTRRSRTTRSGSTPRPPWAATRSASTRAHHYSPTHVGAVAEVVRAAHRLRRQERHLDHLRESWRAFEQSRTR